MKIAVLGTGMVGRALAAGLDQIGHEVTVGTRDPQRTLAVTETDRMGNAPFARWQDEHVDIRLAAFDDAAAGAELVVNATAGAISLDVLEAAGAENLAGKVLLDVAQPLDLANGMPPTLTVANTDSLAEQIQRTFPEARVVKSLNTMLAHVMVDPGRLPGRHNVFVSGDDADAKRTVRELLESFGWPAAEIVDLGGIRSARGPEMYAGLSFGLFAALGTFEFNIAVVSRGVRP